MFLLSNNNQCLYFKIKNKNKLLNKKIKFKNPPIINYNRHESRKQGSIFYELESIRFYF
jgi:hypothetical protein